MHFHMRDSLTNTDVMFLCVYLVPDDGVRLSSRARSPDGEGQPAVPGDQEQSQYLRTGRVRPRCSDVSELTLGLLG